MWTLVLGIPVGIVVGVVMLSGIFGQNTTVILLLAAISLAALYLVGPRFSDRLITVIRVVCLLLALIVGMSIGSLAKHRFQPMALDTNLTYYLTGTVTGVPRWGKYSRRYQVEAACVGSQAQQCDLYRSSLPLWPVVIEVTATGAQPELVPGQRLQIQVRPKQQQLQASPAAFDVKRWLLSTHTVARTALLKGSEVKLLGQRVFTLDRFRAQLNRYLADRREDPRWAGLTSYPVILALVSGDRSLMNDNHWDVFNRTGTTHLVAISGLHIGLVAAFAMFVLQPVFRRWRWFTNRYPASHGAVFGAWWVALFYTAMAGFALPTQRALIMLTVFVVLKLLGRARQLWFGLAAAFCLVLLWDPVACLSMGFWLSFTAVYLILWLIGGEVEKSSATSQWITVQLGLFVGLAPVLLWTVHSVSLVSALTNVVAIPVIGFVVVPVSLLWALLWSVFGDQVGFLLDWAAALQDGLLWLLQVSAGWRYSVWTVGERGFASMALAMVGVLWLVSAGVPGRIWGAVLMLPLLMPQVHGLGAYVMGAGSGRLVFHFEDRVVSLSRSHWPQPLASWQADLMAHWGIGIPPGAITVNNSKALWLSTGAVMSEFELSSNPLGARQLERMTYFDLCKQLPNDLDGEGEREGDNISMVPWLDTRYPKHCAVEIQWQGPRSTRQRWLYWPIDSVRVQRSLLKQLANERFDLILLDVGKGKSVEEGVLSLLKAGKSLIITMKPVPDALRTIMQQRGLQLHTITVDGYYSVPLAEPGSATLHESAEIGSK
ncbi:ComEC/Rec2 family competence protein [Ketobacter alkanivorans]|uniref:ComEC/Rec2-related protein domain-containing protein n=1 Tax=Ketobacter alkanivorans TaxID=1917421 RepID=A0A2K9LQP9_9GAMM|nr:ComEC/Rec2 family competence protein [Ketobacter alkanivorans]AUM14613.1 hypothetical protein Kalk_20225 [Ketobacter alkanivorans]